MPKLDTTGSSFIVASTLAGLIAWGATSITSQLYADSASAQSGQNGQQKVAATQTPASPGKPQWAASAPGRVEPRDGEIRIVSQMPGKVAEVLVAVNDKVRAGDLLFRLEDDEHQARYSGADAEVAVRTRERDLENVGRQAKDRRTAEDAVAKAERAVFSSRFELDRLVAAKAPVAEIDAAREAIKTAAANVDKERANLRKVVAQSGMPLPTRLESGLTVARSDLAVAETMLSRTRVRAPIDGVVLQVNAKVGEMAAPQSELPMVVIGDLSKLRVRSEFDERDIDKVRVGQSAVVTTDAFPGRNFEGKVTQVAKTLTAPRVAQKGPRRPNDVDVLEVFVELDGNTPLLPGMRADVFLKPEGAAAADAAQTKAN